MRAARLRYVGGHRYLVPCRPLKKGSRCAYPILHLITAPSTCHQPKIRKGAPPRKTPNNRRIFILMRKRNERIDRKVRYRAHTRQLTTQIGTSDITTSTPLSAHLVLNISNSRKPSEFLSHVTIRNLGRTSIASRMGRSVFLKV